jgi:hypothetical protein
MQQWLRPVRSRRLLARVFAAADAAWELRQKRDGAPGVGVLAKQRVV